MSTQLAIQPAPAAQAEGARPVPACDIRRALAVVRWPIGAVRAHLLASYPAAAAAGWRFTLVGPADGSLDALRDALGGVPRTEYIGAPAWGRTCRLWPMVRGLLRDGGFDLIHSHGLTAAAHAAAANIGIGVPHIAALYEPLRAADFCGPLGRLKRWALGRLLRRPNAIVTAGEDARANLLEQLPALAGRVVAVAGVGARRTAEHTPDRGLRRRLGVGADAVLVGFLGGVMPDGGFTVLLDAVRRLAIDPTAPPFHLAAFAPRRWEAEGREAVARRGLFGRVTLLGLAEGARPALGQLDLVVVPGPSAEASLAAMEAMAAGVPVLAADAPGLREILRGTPARAVAAGDADALRHGLHLALTRPWTEAARSFAAAARARFDGARGARRLTELFDRLASARRRAA
jgi:glycosyltransferase involved in cell wall biosynthesis